jgi:hypothetical protein
MSPAAISKVEAPEILAISRGSFGQFLSIFALVDQFRPFFRAVFPLLGDFSPPKHVIHARRRGPCTIAHRRIVLKQDVRPQPLSKIFILGSSTCTLRGLILHSTICTQALLKCDFNGQQQSSPTLRRSSNIEVQSVYRAY